MSCKSALWRGAATALAVSLSFCGCGSGKKEAKGGNEPPAIASLRLQPDQPSVDAQLTLEIKGSDPDGDLVFYQVEWLVNGRVLQSGQSQQLSTRGLSPGDQVSARVQASDGSAQSQWLATETVVLWPKLVGIDSLSLEPSPLTAGLTTITASPRLSAFPKPEQMNFSFHWTVDGKAIRDSGGTVVVPPLKIGQKVQVEAIPVLGSSRGKPFRAMATVVGPAPVVGGIEYVGQDSLGYTYRIEASDPSSEPLTFSLVAGPPGTRIDPKSGTITIPREGAEGEIRVRVSNHSGSWVERRVETSH